MKTPEEVAEEIFDLILIQCSGRNEAAESILPRKKKKIVNIIKFQIEKERRGWES